MCLKNNGRNKSNVFVPWDCLFILDLLCRLNSPCTSLLHYQKHDAFVNVEEEIVKLEEELKYTQGFLVGVTKKLSNERFVANAPCGR